MNFSYGFEAPNRQLALADKTVHSGEYHAIGYSLQGMNTKQLEAIKTQLEQAKAKIESKDQTQLASLTKHDLTGAILQAGVQSYFGMNEAQDHIAEQQAGMMGNAYFSFGTFSTSIQPNVRYGITLSASLKGMMMDIDRLSAMRVNTDNDRATWIAFNTAQGPRHSANEHLIPESLFNDPNAITKNVHGISAVKALQIAASQGQKIYRIDQSNISSVLPQIQHKALIIQDIQNAIAAGKVVTISQKSISQNGWTGTGYVIVDPSTGAGSYLIGGGADGGFLLGVGLGGLISAIGIFAVLSSLAIAAIPTIVLFFALILAIISAMLILVSFMMVATDNADMDWACFWAGLGVGLSAGGVSNLLGVSITLLTRTITAIGLGLVAANFFPSFPTYPQCLGYS